MKKVKVTGVVSFGSTYHGGRNCIGQDLGKFSVYESRGVEAGRWPEVSGMITWSSRLQYSPVTRWQGSTFKCRRHFVRSIEWLPGPPRLHHSRDLSPMNVRTADRIIGTWCFSMSTFEFFYHVLQDGLMVELGMVPSLSKCQVCFKV